MQRTLLSASSSVEMGDQFLEAIDGGVKWCTFPTASDGVNSLCLLFFPSSFVLLLFEDPNLKFPEGIQGLFKDTIIIVSIEYSIEVAAVVGKY